MFNSIKLRLVNFFRICLLRGYGWKRRRMLYFGELATQWRDPISLVWVSEKAALKLLHVQVMDEFQRDRVCRKSF